MKCLKCNSEWHSPDNKQSLFCPFCYAPLFEVKKKIYDLNDALSYIVLEFGIDVLKNQQNTLQFLEVFFCEGKNEYSFIKNLYASGLMGTLLRLRNAPNAIQKSASKQVEKQLSEKYGISSDWSEYVVGCVCKAVGIANDVEESIIWIRQSAGRGNPKAQFKMAKRYRSGQGVEKSPEKYIMHLKSAADSECTEAQFLYGMELYVGNICDKNLSASLFYLEQAAKKNDINAMCFILSDYELWESSELKSEIILNYLIERKNELSSNQLIQLSKYYEHIDLAQSLNLTQFAYDKDAKSTWQYYVKILNKSGSHESKALAHKVVKEMAADGNAIACITLAQRYEKLANTKNDMLTAMYWYRMAAELGEIEAQIRLAELYEAGKLIKHDIESAVYWYKIAAFNGSLYAKEKVSYKSPKCILKTLTLLFDDDTELDCQVLRFLSFQGDDYLIIEDPDTKEHILVRYTETDTLDGFEIEQVDEKTEKTVFSKFGGANK